MDYLPYKRKKLLYNYIIRISVDLTQCDTVRAKDGICSMGGIISHSVSF